MLFHSSFISNYICVRVVYLHSWNFYTDICSWLCHSPFPHQWNRGVVVALPLFWTTTFWKLSAHPSIEGESIHEKITSLSKLCIFSLIQMASLHYFHEALKTVIEKPSTVAAVSDREPNVPLWCWTLPFRPDQPHCLSHRLNLICLDSNFSLLPPH